MSSRDDEHAMQVPKEAGAVVRMYNTGLGDCFLLGFPAENGKPTYMMIDCGSLKGTRDVTGRMKRIMESIARTTKDRGIEVLLATHRHWDHLSGFKQAEEKFTEIPIQQVWLGWTENPDDERATRLRLEERRLVKSLRAATHKLRKFGNTAASDRIRHLLAFEDGPVSDDALGATSTDDLLEIVRGRVDRPSYLEPSLNPKTLPDVPSVNLYVLGPPRDLAFIKKMKPSSGEQSEVYVSGSPDNELSAFYTASSILFYQNLGDLSDVERESVELTFPFGGEHGKWISAAPKAEGREANFFRDYYGFERGDKGPSWRRIEGDWLEVSERLALEFDRYRNNTSVALAIELGDDGPVLLFSGDAQVGNWLSWDELRGSPSAEDLLSRTVLYKVGHHGSHNATLKKKGIERMARSRALVAMVPVDEDMARKPKGRNRDGWNMPHPRLLDALIKRTEGRILRSDTGMPKKPDTMTKDDWKAFRRSVRVVDDKRTDTPLFVEYTIQP